MHELELRAEIAKLVSTARLPANYEDAKKALAECERVDECGERADKAAAIASYATQADDVELENHARRIRARAVAAAASFYVNSTRAAEIDDEAKPRVLLVLFDGYAR